MADAATPPPGPDILVEFLNTLDQRTFVRHGQRHEPHDELGSPDALARWFADRGLLGGSAAGTGATAADLADALTVRTALRGSLLSALDGDSDGDGDGDSDSDGRPAALAGFPLLLVVDRFGGLVLDCVAPQPSPASQALATLVAAAATAGVRGTWDRIRVCAAPDCHWAFIDTSRRGDKRWCSTTVCGNRSKTAGYRVRHRETQAEDRP